MVILDATMGAANQKLISFFEGQELTFSIERFGVGGQEWIARCHQVPGLTTGGIVYDENLIQEQIKDALLTAAGVDGEYDSVVSRNISLVNNITASIMKPELQSL